MPSRRRPLKKHVAPPTNAELQRERDDLGAQLNEALERQTATSENLRVISWSLEAAQLVFPSRPLRPEIFDRTS